MADSFIQDSFVPDSFVPEPSQPGGKKINPFTLLDKVQSATQRNEQQISQRPSFIQQIKQDPIGSIPFPFNPKGTSRVLGAAAEIGESIPANIGLGIQQRKGVGQTFKDVVSGVSGQRPAQLGDLARASGLPGISSGAVPATLGFLASSAPAMFTKIGKGLASQGSRALTAPVRDVKNIATFGTRERFVEGIRGSFSQARKGLGDMFETKFDQAVNKFPDKVPDLSDELQQITQHIDQKTPVGIQLLAGAKKANVDLLEVLTKDSVSQREAQSLKQVINSTPALRTRQGFAQGVGQELDDLRSNIRLKQLEATPELEPVFKDYRKGIQQYKLLRPIFQPPHTDEHIFGGGQLLNNTDLRPSLQKFLKYAPEGKTTLSGKADPFADMLGVARASGVKRNAGKIATTAGLSAGAFLLGRGLRKSGH